MTPQGQARRRVLSVAAASTLVVAMPSVAADVPATAPQPRPADGAVELFTKVSAPTPLPHAVCSGGGAIDDAEVEPHLSVDPRNPRKLLAVWQQDRHPDGGARMTMVGESEDGGRSWTRLPLSGVSTCTGGSHLRASDPWSAIGADGTRYAASFAFSDDPESEGDSVLHRSSGNHWEGPITIAADDGTHWHEKPIVVAHPSEPERVYAAWGLHIFPDPSPAGLATTFDVGIGFSRSDRRGLDWSDPVVLPPDLPYANEWPVAGGVLPLDSNDADDVLVVGVATPTRLADVPGCVLYATRTTDGGRTWSEPSIIGTAVQEPPSGDPETVRPVRGYTGCALSSAAVAPDGTVHVAWFERTPTAEHPNGTEIRLSTSADAGASWATSVVAALPQLGFLPTVAVTPEDVVGVAYFDTRHDRLGDDELTTDLWLSWSDDRGLSWRELRLTAESFDLRSAPDASGYMLGDYVGLVGVPSGFGALVALARPIADTGPTDIFYIHASVGPRPGHDPPGS